MNNIHFVISAPSANVSRYVRRVLSTTGKNLRNEIIPIAPTGFDYFTYSRYPVTLHYKNRILISDEQLYLTGQLDKESPFFNITGDFFHIGLEMFPTSLYYLFGLQGIDLTDNGIELRQEQPEFSLRLKERLRNIEDPGEVAEILQASITDKLDNIEPINFLDNGLQLIYNKNGNISIGDLVDELDVSDRHFRRIFKKIVGVGPKQYCKIIQFNSVFEAIQMQDKERLYQLMIENGYYDQSHFINDFKNYLSQSPQTFLKSGHDFLKSYLGTFKTE